MLRNGFISKQYLLNKVFNVVFNFLFIMQMNDFGVNFDSSMIYLKLCLYLNLYEVLGGLDEERYFILIYLVDGCNK